MTESKVVIVTGTHSVECNGKDFPEDHPVIYLEIPAKVGKVICPYCSKTFILERR